MSISRNLSIFADTVATSGNAVSSVTIPVLNGSTTLSLQTGGTTAAYFDASQNVGVGNTSPAYKLDVTGTARATTSVISPIHNSLTTLSLQTGGTTGLFIDASQNVGIGTSSPGANLDVAGTNATARVAPTTTTNNAYWRSQNTGGTAYLGLDNSVGGISAAYALNVWHSGAYPLVFGTNNTERGRFSSTGDLLVGTTGSYGKVTSSVGAASQQCFGAYFTASGGSGVGIQINYGASTGTGYAGYFTYNGSGCGSITLTSGATAYNTSSDYRLKENVQPMQNALATIGALKPVTYSWISDKAHGEGFLAHELQAIIPLAVVGEKDAVNEDGTIKAQGVDYSKIVVHLVAALQELKAEFDDYKAKHP